MVGSDKQLVDETRYRGSVSSVVSSTTLFLRTDIDLCVLPPYLSLTVEVDRMRSDLSSSISGYVSCSFCHRQSFFRSRDKECSDLRRFRWLLRCRDWQGGYRGGRLLSPVRLYHSPPAPPHRRPGRDEPKVFGFIFKEARFLRFRESHRTSESLSLPGRRFVKVVKDSKVPPVKGEGDDLNILRRRTPPCTGSPLVVRRRKGQSGDWELEVERNNGKITPDFKI